MLVELGFIRGEKCVNDFTYFIYFLHFSCKNNRCLAYGVLSKKKSAKLLRIVTERKKNQRQGGMLSPSSSISPKKKKPKIVREEGVDPDLQTSGTERVTSATL